MLVVKVELHPFSDSTPERVTEIARMTIANDGTGTSESGNYWGRTTRKGNNTYVIRQGTVTDYPRKNTHVWNLVARMLKSMSYE